MLLLQRDEDSAANSLSASASGAVRPRGEEDKLAAAEMEGKDPEGPGPK